MDIFIARQPIFNIHRRLFAYELLNRGTKDSTLSTASGNKATTSVLSSAFLSEGIENISGSRPCFINFTRDLLLQNIAVSFPKKMIVVEVLEDIPATPDVIEACRKLKREGYTIALDDFIYDPSLEPLIRLADIVKFDLRLSSVETIEKTLRRLSTFKLKYLAEKVESHEEFAQMSALGFSLFQGYFFCRPERIRIREIDSAKINLVHLLAEVNRKTTSFHKLEQIIRNDVGITYKLLRYINSSYFYRLSKIDSVAHAIAYLGSKEIQRFIILILISELATDKPDELVRLAVVRAKMCQLMARETLQKDKDDEFFLLGLFSLLDAMLDTSMQYICKQLSLGDQLRDALISQSGAYSPYLELVLCYEKRDKPGCIVALAKVGVIPNRLHPMYMEAISFAGSILDEGY